MLKLFALCIRAYRPFENTGYRRRAVRPALGNL